MIIADKVIIAFYKTPTSLWVNKRFFIFCEKYNVQVYGKTHSQRLTLTISNILDEGITFIKPIELTLVFTKKCYHTKYLLMFG